MEELPLQRILNRGWTQMDADEERGSHRDRLRSGFDGVFVVDCWQ